jgi:His-Xaa-Ser system protein HxsD
MTPFLTQNSENNRLELLLDGELFSDQIAMKAAYTFLDRAYFFFRKDGANTIVQIHPKEGQRWSSEGFAFEYSDEILAVHLRYLLEKENKNVRDAVVHRALGSYMDAQNFVQVEPSQPAQLDFDKDIDEILKEIENDPDLQIDEDEIAKILAEIEAETTAHQAQKKPKIDPNKLKDVKKNFQN